MGYTISANGNGRFTSNTDFRTFGQFLSNGLANAGLIKTSDTGQVDWSTVPMPNTTYQECGYEIWRFNDALQNTAPVYIKIGYGSGATANTPMLRWTIGSGTAGNGTVTGFVSRSTNLSGNVYSILTWGGVFANNTLWWDFSGDTNRFAVSYGARGTGSSGTSGSIWGIERTVDANGDVTGDGVLVAYKAGATPASGMMVWSPRLGPIMHDSSGTDGLGILAPERGGGTTGSNTAVYPLFWTWGGGGFLPPGLNFLGYWNAEMTTGTTNTFTYYGASHTYLPLGNTLIYGASVHSRGNNQLALMMRWE